MQNKQELAKAGLIRFLGGAVMLGLLLFLPAGTLRWTGGWLFLGVLFLPMLILGIVLLMKAPALLEKRLHSREQEQTQRSVVALSGLMFLAGFVLAGLDFRFGWLQAPRIVQYAAAVVFLAGYAGYAEVMRENSYLSRTVEVTEGQHVVDTGLYGIVRHPMYAVTLLMFLSMPLVLGSFVSFFVFLIYPVLIVRRILNEEQVLRRDLPGYAEYCTRVRYRLLPKIW